MQSYEISRCLKQNITNKFIVVGDIAFSMEVILKTLKGEFKELTIKDHENAYSFQEAVLIDPDFIGERRAHIVRDVDASNIEYVLEYSMNLSPSEVLVVVCPKRLGKNKHYTRMRSDFGIIEEEELKTYGSDYSEWVHSYWIGLGIKFSKTAPDLLIDKVGKNRVSLMKATRVLRLYSGEDKISDNHINSCFHTNAVSDFFGFLDDFTSKRVSSVIDKLDSCKESECVGLSRALVKEMNKVLTVSTFMADNVADEAISGKTGIHLWVLKTKYKKIVQSMGRSNILKSVNILSDSEKTLKTSKHSSREILKAYCLKAMA